MKKYKMRSGHLSAYFRINNTTVRVTSAHNGFTDFLTAMLERHQLQQPEVPDVSAEMLGYRRNLFGRKAESGRATIENTVAVDKAVRYYGRSMVATSQRTTVQLSTSEVAPYLAAVGEYYERIDRVVRAWVRPGIRFNAYQQILRSFVLQPVFLHEELRYGYRPLHAGVVTNGHRTLVLAGLSGVGKSTLTLFLATHEGWRFITDNYALYKGHHIVGVQEPVRVSMATREMVGVARLDHILGRRAYVGPAGRHAYHVVSEGVAEAYVTDVLFLQLGDRFSMRQVGEEFMDNLLLRSENVLGEFHTYTELSTWWNDIVVPPDRGAMRRALLEGRSLYICTVSRDDSLEATVGKIDEYLQFL